MKPLPALIAEAKCAGVGPVDPNNGAADADGNFQLASVTGRVFFNVPVPARWMLKSVTLNGEDITDQPLDVTGRQSVSGLQITLTDRVTDVSGLVTDDRGQPVTDAMLFFPPAEPMEPLATSRWIRQARPLNTGRYQLRTLRPGRYVAVALDYLEPGRQFAPEFQKRLRQTAREFTVREAEPITVDLKLTSGL